MAKSWPSQVQRRAFGLGCFRLTRHEVRLPVLAGLSLLLGQWLCARFCRGTARSWCFVPIVRASGGCVKCPYLTGRKCRLYRTISMELTVLSGRPMAHNSPTHAETRQTKNPNSCFGLVRLTTKSHLRHPATYGRRQLTGLRMASFFC